MSRDSEALIREYRSQYQPRHSYKKKESWLSTLGKVDFTLPVLGIVCIGLTVALIKRAK